MPSLLPNWLNFLQILGWSNLHSPFDLLHLPWLKNLQSFLSLSSLTYFFFGCEINFLLSFSFLFNSFFFSGIALAPDFGSGSRLGDEPGIGILFPDATIVLSPHFVLPSSDSSYRILKIIAYFRVISNLKIWGIFRPPPSEFRDNPHPNCVT